MTDTTEQHPVCRYCASANVTADASATYSQREDDWELSSVHDGGRCNDCGEDMKFFTWVDTRSD